MAVTQEQLQELYFRVQDKLVGIEGLVGKDYRLTLVSRYIGEKPFDADIIFTTDDVERVKETIDKMQSLKPMMQPADRK